MASAPSSGLLTDSPVVVGGTGHPGVSAAENASCVWGVDPSTRRISIGVATETGMEVRTRSFNPKLKDGARLAHIHAETRDLAFEMLSELGAPERVYVEQPFAYGHQVEPSLYYAVGTVMAALTFQLKCEVVTIPVGTWKKEATGRGNAKKPEIVRWAQRYEGYAGSLEDEADAIGIARAGWRIVHAPVQQSLA